MPTLSNKHRQLLMQWFAIHARPLPWRLNRDPYRIWVSEVMLQQTTVATVSPRFEQFITRFPTIHDLAKADEQQVLKCWEGLGYYRRARHLHHAAKLLVQQHQGTIPNDPDVFGALTGVGKYILGAVLSQAFDRRLPIVEANTRRVLCRLFGQTEDPKSSTVERWLWERAEAILPATNVGDFNQAMMELGALICTPTKPDCAQCPLRSPCIARREGLQDQIPKPAEPPATENVVEVCVVPTHQGRYLLFRRGPKGRWANMWEFPRLALRQGEKTTQGVKRLLHTHTLTKNGPTTTLLTINYAVTRYRIEMHCVLAECSLAKQTLGEYVEARWVTPAELADYPVSTAQRKLANLLLARSSPTGLESS